MNRKRIEEIPKNASQYIAYGLGLTRTSFFGTVAELEELCTLALRGLSDRSLPKIEWHGGYTEGSAFAAIFGAHLSVVLCDDGYLWEIVTMSCKLSGTADSLEAAQKAAEDALAKLVGGEG